MLQNCFIPRQWRLARFVWFLILLEFPFTVANLSIFGVASPNLYRNILWTYGGKRGWNSDPSTVLYAAANYKPVDTPIVWSSYNTQYNLYIGVICMFFYLLKITGWLLHVCYPIISLPLHIALTALWAISIHVQTAPDTIDPERQNHGAPWYITKSCNVVNDDKTIKSYCMQAKSAFAISICMLIIYAAHILFAAYSLYPTKEARLAHATKVAERKAQKEKWASSPSDNEMTAEEQWQHMWELQQLPRTPGTATGPGWGKMPMTPRTRAFGQLEGGQEQYYQQQHELEYGHGGLNGNPNTEYYVNGNGNGYGIAQAPAGYAPPGYVHQGQSQYNYDGKGTGTAM